MLFLVVNEVIGMAEKGNLFLDNGVVIKLYEQAKQYEATVHEAFYSQYKTAYKISVSNYFRGDAADTFKNYITNGAINIISGFLDLASDMSMMLQLFAEAFYQYEQNHEGKVDEPVLDYINSTLNSKEEIYSNAQEELNKVLSLASAYITTQPLSWNTVTEGYSETRSVVKKIREDLYTVDDEAVVAANELYTRIVSLRTLIEQMRAFCYNDDGTINADNLPQIRNQKWYHNAGNVTLYLMLQEDPFEYCAGEVAVAEDQWAVGLCSDVYAYAGYSCLSAKGEAGIENGTAFANGKALVLAANGYAQFTDYLSANAKVNVAYAEGSAKAGWSEDYVGFKVSGDVGLIQADGTVMLGSEDLNAYIKGEVKVLCADGKAAFEFEDDGEFAFGFDASATAASASVSGGISVFSYKEKDSATGEEKPLLGFEVEPEANLGAGAAFYMESKTAYEGEIVNINATKIKIKAVLGVGGNISITVPTVHFRWPW